MTTAQLLSQERGRLGLSLPQQKIAASHRWKVSHSGTVGTFIRKTVKLEPGGISVWESAQSHESSTFTADYGYRVPAVFAVEQAPEKIEIGGGWLVHGSTEPLRPPPGHEAHERYFSPAPETNLAADFETAISAKITYRIFQDTNRFLEELRELQEFLEQRQEQEEKQDRQRLWDRLDASFAHEDLDPDRDHPAERTLGQALFSPRTRRWLVEFCADEGHPELAASLLLCLCRLPALYLVEWEKQLITRALACNDVEIRDAAVQLAAAWGGDHLQGLLQSHQDSEDWLQDYIGSVLADWSI